MTIPAAAVTEFAAAFYASTEPLAYTRIEAGLTAAKPHIQAQALDIAADSVERLSEPAKAPLLLRNTAHALRTGE